MAKLRTPQHYSDAGLLNFLDGELGPVQRVWARLHLFRCWECRARKAELEAQAHRLARAVRNDVFPDQQSVFDAREAFETRRMQFECSQDAPDGAVAQRRTRRASPVKGVTAVLALAIAIGYLAFVHRRGGIAPPVEPVEQRASAARLDRKEVDREEKTTPAPLPATPGRVISATRPAAGSPRLEAEADMAALELNVHYRLHRIGACAAEPVTIWRRAELPIIVSAIGPPQERRLQIHAALADLERSGRVKVEITEVGEAVGSETGVQDLPPARSSLPFAQGELARRFGTPEAFVRSANAVLSELDTIYAHAWALRKHASLPGSDKGRSDPRFWLREAMERDHVVRLRQALSKLNVELTPVIPGGMARARISDADLFEYSKEAAVLIHRLFTPDVAEKSIDTQAETLRLAAILAAMDAELGRVEGDLSRSLSHSSGDAPVGRER